MRIEHLQFLVEVAKYRSISTAAKKLYISQTGLSAIVSSIEEELNIHIFSRTNKGIILTEEGARALELMQNILNTNDELHCLSSENNTQNRIINLGVFPAGSSALSHYLMHSWVKANPHTHLHIYEVKYEDTEKAIKKRTADIIIGASLTDNPFMSMTARDDNLCIESLYTDHFRLLVSASSELAGRSCVDLSEILDMHLLFTHAYPGPSDRAFGANIHRFGRYTVLSNLGIAMSILLENPDAIIILPSLAAYRDPLVRSGQLKLLEITGFDTTLEIFLAYDISCKLRLSESQLLDAIRSFFTTVQS